MNVSQALPKGSRYNPHVLAFFGAVALFLVTMGVAIGVTETNRPGYGWGSFLVKTPDAFAAAKAKDEARIAEEKAAKEKLAAEQEEAFAKSEALKQFTKLNVTKVSFKTKCPNPETWRTLSDEDKQLLRAQLFKENTLLMDYRFCPQKGA